MNPGSNLWVVALLFAASLAGCSDDQVGAPVNAPCVRNQDCADRVCHGGMCASSSPVGQGKACQGNGDCKSFNCQGGICRAGTVKNGAPCILDQQCLGGRCNSAGVCGPEQADAGPADAPRPDHALPDSVPLADRAAPDRRPADAPLPDAPLPDAPLPDKPLPDAPLPDIAPPDLLQPDASLCGNGKLDPTEFCDAKLLGGKTCKTQGFAGGTLTCTAQCKLDDRACYTLHDPAGFKVGSHKTYGSHHPRVSTDGKGWFVVWGQSFGMSPADTSWLAGAMVNGLGKAGAQFNIINTQPKKRDPDVVFGHLDYLVIWDQGTKIYGTTVSPAGTVGTPLGTLLASHKDDILQPALAYGGSMFLLTYWTYDLYPLKKLWSRCITAAGAPSASSFTLSPKLHNLPGNSSARAEASFDGVDYLAAWSTNSSVLAARVSTACKRINNADMVVTQASGNQLHPALASNGVNTLVTWQDHQSGGTNLNSLVVPPSKPPPAKTTWVAPITSKTKCAPAVGWDGERYLVVYNEGGKCHEGNVKGMLMTKAGAPFGAPFDITPPGGTHEVVPDLAFAGGKYLVVWADSRSKNWEVYAGRLSFGKGP